MQNPNDVDEGFEIEHAKAYANALASLFAEIAGDEELRQLNINELFQEFLNLIPSIKISDFELERASIPIPGYRPGVFPDEFIMINTIPELDTIASQSLAVSFIIEVEGASRIKARGFGELDLYKEGDKIQVKAKDLWFIEEVQEIEPRDENIPKRLDLLTRVIKDVIIAFIVQALVAFLNR